jgi:phenylalanyl-tRNA synthetase beta chain
MKYTKQLLSRYISGSYDLDLLARNLTLKSCEVEEVYERKLPDLIVIGKVVSCEKHPDADKLTICQVDCGSKGIFQICTWATNIRADIYVPVALPGCFLPAIHLQIDPRMMRGVESNGMICSKEELGIAEDIWLHGIWILQEGTSTNFSTDFTDLSDKDLGTAMVTHAPWLENRILDVENKTITHRPDMFGHFWLAREINAIFPESIRFSRLQSIADQIIPTTLLHTLSQATSSVRSIHIDSPFVGTYNVIELDDVVVKESSLRQRLQLLDLWLTSRNNRVDFSNYFMYLTGQPIHCFDAAQIEGSLVIRQAEMNESFIDLFDTEHHLTENDIVICDDKGILALAGIIWGKRSGISETTTSIVIEIAQFDPVVIRKTAMRLGIRTDAQTRFEKHIAPSFSLASILLCLDELEFLWKKELGNWMMKWTFSRINQAFQKTLTRQLPFEFDQINRMLWLSLHEEDMLAILERLWLRPTPAKNMLIVPARRGIDDLHHTADVAEEVGRMYWFDNIWSETYHTSLQAIPFSNNIATMRKTEQLMSEVLGYIQVETYPRLHSRWHAAFPPSANSSFSMENSMAPELGYLRETMIPSLLEIIEKNAPLYETLRVFDIGTVRNKNTEVSEKTMLTMARIDFKWSDRRHDPFLLIKQDVETILASYTDLEKTNWTHSTYARWHTTQQADIYLGTTLVGTVAHLHPRLVDEIGIDGARTVVVAQLDCMLLGQLNNASQDHKNYATLQDQHIWRDISFVLPREGNYGHMRDALLSVPEIVEVKLLDLYTGSTLAENEKSISLSFLIHGDGSLTSEQIATIMQKAIDAGQMAWGKLRQ